MLRYSKLQVKHSLETGVPSSSDISYGEIVMSYVGDKVVLYTKNIYNEVVELGKGVDSFSDLLDVDLTNLQDGSYFRKIGDKYTAVNFIGSISDLVDVEVSTPLSGQYLRYDALFGSFRNFGPSYSLYQLLDVELPNLFNSSASSAINNHVLYYDHASGKFKTRARLNLLNDLADVDVSRSSVNQILSLDADLIWRANPLDISKDTSPTLGGDLNCNNYAIQNSAYKIQTITVSASITPVNYNNGDYWVIIGGVTDTIIDCTIPVANNTSAIVLVELRQSTGKLLFGNLTNVKYEDGNPIKLSGAGKVDLITINVVNANNVVTTYITAAALNLATLNNGGVPAYRYDQRYNEPQTFSNADLYDSYYDYVELLYNYQPESLTSKAWYEDKADKDNTITLNYNVSNLPTGLYYYNIEEYVASFVNNSSIFEASYSTPITLAGDFTLECYVQLTSDDYTETGITYTLFKDTSNDIKIEYYSTVASGVNSYFKVTLGLLEWNYNNAFRVFRYQDNRYVHIALVRSGEVIKFYVDGYELDSLENQLDTGVTELTINGIQTNLRGNVNNLRLTSYARYLDNFNIPSLWFALTGGAVDILDASVFNYYRDVDQELEVQIFSG